MEETRVLSLGLEDPLEKGMVTHSSILAWRISLTEEPGGLHSPRGCKESDMTEWLTHKKTLENLHDDSTRRQLSMKQKECLSQTLNLLVTWS